MKRILDGNAVPYTVHYIDIDESASEELANAKRGREKDSLPLLAAGASMLLVRSRRRRYTGLWPQC